MTRTFLAALTSMSAKISWVNARMAILIPQIKDQRKTTKQRAKERKKDEAEKLDRVEETPKMDRQTILSWLEAAHRELDDAKALQQRRFKTAKTASESMLRDLTISINGRKKKLKRAQKQLSTTGRRLRYRVKAVEDLEFNQLRALRPRGIVEYSCLLTCLPYLTTQDIWFGPYLPYLPYLLARSFRTCE